MPSTCRLKTILQAELLKTSKVAMICDIDFTCVDGTRFRLKTSLEKEKIDHEETLSQQKKEYMTEVKVCSPKADMEWDLHPPPREIGSTPAPLCWTSRDNSYIELIWIKKESLKHTYSLVN